MVARNTLQAIWVRLGLGPVSVCFWAAPQVVWLLRLATAVLIVSGEAVVLGLVAAGRAVAERGLKAAAVGDPLHDAELNMTWIR